MTDRRWPEIDVLYSLGMILVVFGHSHSSDWETFAGTALCPVIEFIYVFHMPLFFCIAGFLFMNSGSLERLGFGSWLRQKGERLLIPYVVLSVVGLIPKYYIENHGFEGFTPGYLLKVLFVPRIGVWGHFWFLPTLLLIYVWFGLWKSLRKGRFSDRALGCAALASLALYFLPYGTAWFGVNDVKEFTLFFVIGMIGRKWADGKRRAIPKPYMILWIAAGFVFSAAAFPWCPIHKLVKLITAIVMISVCLQLAAWIGKNRICQWLSERAYPVYIYSWLFQAAAMVIATRMKLPWYSMTILMFAVGLLAPLMLVQFYQKQPLHNRFFDLLIGIKHERRSDDKRTAGMENTAPRR